MWPHQTEAVPLCAEGGCVAAVGNTAVGGGGEGGNGGNGSNEGNGGEGGGGGGGGLEFAVLAEAIDGDFVGVTNAVGVVMGLLLVYL